jgi:lipopolysaccharide/colanic/teichoic acid biosynthesis glycosyltransferase
VTKRIFDIVVAALALVLLAPLLLLAALLVRISSRGPVLFRQERIGRGFRPFTIYKFRTMVADAPVHGGPITIAGDRRVTPIGRLLRKTKVDELPQLLNVLRGDMSFVGPRPEVRQYVELFSADYAEILRVPPGITDLASLKYRDEAELLAGAADPEAEYVRRVLPDKIRLAREYLERASFGFDLALILKTVLRVLGFRVAV